MISNVKEITLNNLLPRVFDGMQSQAPVSDSEVWLRHVTLHKGERYLIAAESGTGKSSLISFIYGLRHDYLGKISFDGVDTSSLSRSQWSRLRQNSIAWLPQEMRLFPELTALENIMIKNRLTDYRSEAEIRAMLERLEIDNRADFPAGNMSVGQQQRVAIIRAICQPFDFLLLDEPVSHLDARNNAIVAQLVTEAASQLNAAIITTSVGNHLSINPTTTLQL